MKYKYLLQCWVRPHSGFDLAKKNKIITIFKNITSTLYPSEALNTAIKKFEKTNEGLIVEPFTIDSNKIIKNPEEDVMPEIRVRYPEAKLLSFELLK